MSLANVEIVKREIDADNRRDIDLIFEFVTDDFEWVPAIVVMIEGESVRDREGMERYFREVEETWEEYRLVTDEFRDLGERVLVFGRIEGRAATVPFRHAEHWSSHSHRAWLLGSPTRGVLPPNALPRNRGS
jgi:ketosteroid isomerase-like protein